MQRDFSPTVYILASHRNGTLYTGVASDLMARLHQHRRGAVKGFTADNGVKRPWKIEMIENGNPDWRDLAVDLGFDMEPSTRLK